MKTNENLSKLMDRLAEDESTEIHRNSKESDITTMYGIYRSIHPRAKIFKEIDKLADSLDLPSSSKDWNKEDINTINTFINSSSSLTQKFYLLAENFYRAFFRYARLHLFPKDCVIAMASMYANSPRLAWESVQFAVNCMSKNKLTTVNKISVDGGFGNQTKRAMIKTLETIQSSKHLGLLFESYMLMGMAARYSILIKRDPDKYMPSSTGWDNRLIDLMESR